MARPVWPPDVRAKAVEHLRDEFSRVRTGRALSLTWASRSTPRRRSIIEGATDCDASDIYDIAAIKHRHRARFTDTLRQLFHRPVRQVRQVKRSEIAVTELEHARCQKKMPTLRSHIAEVLQG